MGSDTLVSIVSYIDRDEGGWEFLVDGDPSRALEYRSISDPEAPEFIGALSEEDFICRSVDTFTASSGYGHLSNLDFLDYRPHRPLNLGIEQRSYAWSVEYAEDFVLFDVRITNIGQSFLEQVYVGIQSDQDCGQWSLEEDVYWISEDDICGFLRTYPSSRGCGFVDTVGLAWVADNDGDPIKGEFKVKGGNKSPLSVEGIRFLQLPKATQQISYNWWVRNYGLNYDFGPRRKPTPDRPLRNFHTGGTGEPLGDRNKYYLMSNGEWDYDQPYVTAIWPGDPEWMFPPFEYRDSLANGDDAYYVLSFGPFRLAPGAQLSLAFAYIAGENFHTDPNNGINLINKQPTTWYQNVSFDDIALNSMWAEWLYDNPGVDTDSDGYAGEYRVCVLDSQFIGGQWVITAADTTYHHGDGVPDWRGVQPPPPPVFWLEPQLNGIRIRFNGQASETTKDIFSGLIDFEGYHIWLGRDERESSLSLLASYDRENYDKWVWNKFIPPAGDFVIQDVPMTLDEIRCRYGSGIDPCDDSLFHPLSFDRTNPYRYKYAVDSIFYFTPHDKNVYRLGTQTPIRKVYPDAHKPTGLDTVKAEDLTPEGYLKYYEYECMLENLLPTIPYHINVTAYDFGSPKVKLPSLETSKMMGLEHAFPYADEAQTDTTLPPVYIYPNPYRIDADYRAAGFEGRGSSRIPDRDRRVHFVNVPPRCTIRIHSLDGDLIREIRHDFDPADPNSRHDSWDLINRNIQTVVSGLYYWSVEAVDGSVQMGTLAIIK
ncbi:MAG: hypothetical protein NDJ18_08885 [candidate division Zixibacteria bacterium]|nr:hypothetical protein [candidate division Zixibacteria bacterium]